MSIYKDIERATHIPSPENNVLFVRSKGSQRAKSRLNRCRPTASKNFLEDSDTESYGDMPSEYFLNENEIVASIRMANGGISYSNDILECHWKSKNLENNSDTTENKMSSSNESTHPSESDDSSTDSTLKSNNNASTSTAKRKDNPEFQEKMEALRRCKLSKNAAILGLLKKEKLSIQDLHITDDRTCANVNNEASTSACNGNTSSVEDSTEDKYKMRLVQCPEDPEVLVQPLQACGTIDESEYKEIDFTVEHIGKKKTITPKQFYTYKIDNTDIDYIRKDSKPK